MSKLRRVTSITVVLPIAALLLSACVPRTGAAPAAVNCDGIAGGHTWVLETCHNRYKAYKQDTTSPASQNLANWLAANLTSCSNLGAYHSSGGALLAAYPGATSVGENLYCYGGAPGTCPTASFAATKAMNAWIASPGHKANLDNFAGTWVNAAAACNHARGLYFGVAQFHKP